MKLHLFIISLAFHSTFAKTHHELQCVLGCFNNGNGEAICEIDGDLAMYTDFESSDIVVTVPPYAHFDIGPYPDVFRNAMKARKSCITAHVFIKAILEDTEGPEVSEPPVSILYPADEVQNGIENRLICYVHRFYPPRVNITWTKNNRPVSEGVIVSSYMLNDDHTFHFFATLTFIPIQGDVYSCTVEHSALDKPKTKIWDVDLSRHQNPALDVYCGLGLSMAFVGVTIGTFLIVKGRYGH